MHPGVMLIVRFRTELPFDEGQRRYRERMDDFRALPGLRQQYYLRDPQSGEWSGVYLFDTRASRQHYVESDLRKSIGAVYEVEGTPRVEVSDVVEVLRPERP